jgi:hypothetical protein
MRGMRLNKSLFHSRNIDTRNCPDLAILTASETRICRSLACRNGVTESGVGSRKSNHGVGVYLLSNRTAASIVALSTGSISRLDLKSALFEYFKHLTADKSYQGQQAAKEKTLLTIYGPESYEKVLKTSPVFASVAVCAQVVPSSCRAYTISTGVLPETGLASPSNWPKLPKREQRIHHCPVVAPHQLLSAHDSRVVWTRSPVPLDIPGHKNSTPFWVEGAVPGVIVVTALTMVDLVGPRDTAPPHESRRVIVLLGALPPRG